MQEALLKIIDYLNKTKTRCTYGAVAEFLDLNSQSVGQLLGDRRPEVSWIVRADTGKPSYYKESELHPDLSCRDEIISSAHELRSRLKAG